jgi:hypothetical protein
MKRKTLPSDIRTAKDLKRYLKRNPHMMPRSLELYADLVRRMKARDQAELQARADDKAKRIAEGGDN